MAPTVPTGSVVAGMQLPVQAQSRYFVEDWELSAGPAEILQTAKAADDAGLFYVGVCDHVAIPNDLAQQMRPVWYDTIATLGYIAGNTSHTRLLSTVFNLLYRHPLVAAKSFSTLDVLSSGRVIVGIGAGHVEKEFAALGVEFASRGKDLDASLAVFEQALRDGVVDGMQVEPRSIQQPRPPIWIGGGAPAAVRRAARLADGWLPQGTPLEQMPELVTLYRDEREAADFDRVSGDIGAISPWIFVGEPSWDINRPAATGSPDQILAELRQWADVGVNHLQVRFPSRDAGELCDQIAAFGEQVLPHLSG